MRLKFSLLIILQVVLLVSIIVYRHYWIAANEHILLQSVPVDPRDIFRGDYVTLDYDISQMDLDKLGVAEKFRRNDTIYASLQKTDKGIYKLASVSKYLPSNGKFIKGRVKYVNEKTTRREITIKQETGNLRVLEQAWFSHKVGENVLFCIGAEGRVNSSYKAKENAKCRRDGEEAIVGTVEAIKEVKYRQVNAEYGIEHYFVEEGKGRAIEARRNAGDVKVEVALRKDGKGLIAALYLDTRKIP